MRWFLAVANFVMFLATGWFIRAYGIPSVMRYGSTADDKWYFTLCIFIAIVLLLNAIWIGRNMAAKPSTLPARLKRMFAAWNEPA